MKKYFLLLCLLWGTVTFSQEIITDKFYSVKSNTPVIEVEPLKSDVVTLKNVVVLFSLTKEQHTKSIKVIENTIGNDRDKNSVFYIVDFAGYTTQSYEKIASTILCEIQERKMMLEADLYIFSDRDFSTQYQELKKSNDKIADNPERRSEYKGYLLSIAKVYIGENYLTKIGDIINN